MPGPPQSQTPPPKHPYNQFNWMEWLSYLDDEEIGEAQKREMIETLWSIVIAFVDLGWEIADTPKESCGQPHDLKAALAAAVVNSEQSSEPDEPRRDAPRIAGTEDAA